MTAYDLNLGVEKPLPGKMGQKLPAKEVRINPLLDTGLSGVPTRMAWRRMGDAKQTSPEVSAVQSHALSNQYRLHVPLAT